MPSRKRFRRLHAGAGAALASALTVVSLTATATASAAVTGRADGAATHVSGPGARVLTTMAELARAVTRRHGHRPGPPAGAITGAVLSPLGRPLAGACVVAHGSSGTTVAMAQANGRFVLSGLKPGSYRLEYRDCAVPGRYLSQWYGAGPAGRGRRVLVSPGRLTPLAAARLTSADPARRLPAPPARLADSRSAVTISGTVRDKAGKRLAGICVDLTGVTGGKYSAGAFGYELPTNSRGGYRATGLPAARYQVEFTVGCGNNGNYAPQWWRNAARASRARTIRLRKGQSVTGVNGSLTVGAQISGMVRYQSRTGRPLRGICVNAVGHGRAAGGIYGFAVTGRNGAFRIPGLGTGRYRLEFGADCGNNGNFLPASLDAVRARAGRTTSGLLAVMQRGGQLTGEVTDTHGRPVKGVCVVAADNYNGNAGQTNADGVYTISQLTTGAYEVAFSGGCGDHGSYAPQWYSHRTNPDAADTMPVIAGQTTSGVDAALSPGATLAGRVTDAAGKAMPGVCAAVTTPSATALLGTDVALALGQTNRNGAYRVPDIPPGQYQVNFTPCDTQANVATQWFQSSPGVPGASVVSARAGAVTSGVDAALSAAGGIRGILTTAAGHPLPGGGCVVATSLDDGTATWQFVSGRRYEIPGLQPGRYQVEFSACGGPYADQWYRGQASPLTATPVTVAAGQMAMGIDGSLSASGWMSGTVGSSVSHGPVRNACVLAYDPATGSASSAMTDRRGQFVMTGLDSGSFWVETFLCSQGNSDLAAQLLPRPVRVTAPGRTRGVRVTLHPGGGLTGVVFSKAPGRKPAAGFCALALPRGLGVGSLAMTGKGGGYLMYGLAPGEYDLYIGPQCELYSSNLAPQWYRNQPAEGAATPIEVRADTVTSGITTSLAHDGAVSGTVTGPGSAALTGVCAVAVPVVPSGSPFSVGTGRTFGITASGRYTIRGLTPGRYQVEFTSGCGAVGYATQWYDGASSQQSATVITVPAATTVRGISASLTPGS